MANRERSLDDNWLKRSIKQNQRSSHVDKAEERALPITTGLPEKTLPLAQVHREGVDRYVRSSQHICWRVPVEGSKEKPAKSRNGSGCC